MQTIFMFLCGLFALLLAIGSVKSIGGAGQRLGTQRLLAGCTWGSLGLGLLLISTVFFSFFGWILLALSLPFGVGWALAASANKERMLPRS